jgi:hypothetical protein
MSHAIIKHSGRLCNWEHWWISPPVLEIIWSSLAALQNPPIEYS